MWSLGALLELVDREKMETFLFNYNKEHGGLNLPDVNKGMTGTLTTLTSIFQFALRQCFSTFCGSRPLLEFHTASDPLSALLFAQTKITTKTL